MKSALKVIGRDIWGWVGSPSYWAIVAGVEAAIYAAEDSALALGLAVFFALLSIRAAVASALAPGNLAWVEINYGSPPSDSVGGPGGARL